MNVFICILFVLTLHPASYAITNYPNNQNIRPEKTFQPDTNYVQISIKKPKPTDAINPIFDFLSSYPILKLNMTQSLLSWMNMTSKKSNYFFEAYDRTIHFGGWVKKIVGPDCQSTRAKVLIRDTLVPVTMKENNCTVATGKWNDHYTMDTFKDAQDIQIDHMVPMKNAYVSGAYKWTYLQRCLYGNYMGYKNHLIPIFGEENNQKSDHTPIDYMPPNDTYKCTYLKDWLFIKGLWGLTMSVEEASSIKDLIRKYKCDLTKMTITDREIRAQIQFANKNRDLCVYVPPPDIEQP